MKTATSSNTLKTCAFVVLSSISFASTSQSLELKGEIKCGPGTNGDPGFSQPLSIQFTNGYGVGMTESNDTLENQEVVIASDGTVNFNAIGIWKNQLQRRWRIHGIGTINGTSIQAAGGMYGNSASELVRPKCEISLKSTAPIVAPAAKSAGYQVETFGQPLGVSPSSLDSGARFREWGLERGFPWSFRATPTNTPRHARS